jgi:hypothetical protein
MSDGVIIRKAFRADLDHVLASVSPERGAELTATAWHDNPQVMAAEIAACLTVTHPSTPHFMFALERAPWPPFAIVGVLAFGPGYGGMIWAAGADAPLRSLSMYRWWHQVFVPQILEKYYRRVEFTALASDHGSRDWLRSVRFTEEGIAYRQGKRGEDFVHFAWVNPDPTVGVAP